MSQSIVSEPTVAEHRRAASFAPPSLEQFSAELEASAPTPRPRDEPVAHDGVAWRLPRVSRETAYGLHPHACKTGIAIKDDFLTVELMTETVQPARHLVGARTAELAAAAATDAYSRLLQSEEWHRASKILPEHASASRALAAASAKLAAIEQKRARLVANPAKGIGKSLVDIDAQAAAVRAEVEAHKAEADALAGAAATARADLAKAAATHAVAAKNASFEARIAKLIASLGAMFEKFGDELLEVALTSATRGADPRIDVAGLVRAVEKDLTADPEE